jgi:hypothetical protein
MNCWHCNTQLIWGGDHDCEDDDPYLIVTNLSCPNCDFVVDVYLPKGKEQKKNENNLQ